METTTDPPKAIQAGGWKGQSGVAHFAVVARGVPLSIAKAVAQVATRLRVGKKGGKIISASTS